MKDNRVFEYVANFKYLGMTVTKGNLFHEGIESRLNSGIECYHSIRNILSSRISFALTNFKVENYNFVCGCVQV
jgi:hypothetical protein